MHQFSTAAMKSSALTVLRDPQAGAPGLLNVPVGVSRWLTRTACAAHFYQCGFGLPSELFGRATGSPLRRFVTRTYAQSGLG